MPSERPVVEMLDHVLATPAQLRWAAGLAVPALAPARDVILVGMGGSGMAARVAALFLAAGGRRAAVHQGYDLPSWVGEAHPLLIAVSYSGNTEETLSAIEEAARIGLPVVVVSTGGVAAEMAGTASYPMIEVPDGLQPRAALGYQTGAVLRILHGVGLVGDPGPSLLEAAAEVEALAGEGDGPGVALGGDLAEALDRRLTVVYGGIGLGALAAGRWKTQINENAKMPAFAAEVPELDHNEIEGWTGLPELGRRSVGVVVLSDPGDHPRVSRRLDLTREVLEGRVELVGEVRAQGAGMIARFFTLAFVGDVTSVRMAELAGVDATPVPLLDDFKRRLWEA